MLSEETASGHFPVESVRVMKRIAGRTEAAFPFRAWTRKFGDDPDLEPREAVARAACQLAETIDAAAILTCTQSGSTTRLVAKYRPYQPLLALTPCEETFLRASLIWGVIHVRIPRAQSADAMEKQALLQARNGGWVRSGQIVVLTAGLPLHLAGTTNVIKVATVP